MKLSAIYNLWIDSIEHLSTSINYIKDYVDLIIIVDQTISNKGENIRAEELKEYTNELNRIFKSTKTKIISRHYVPDLHKSPLQNETTKRNIGIEIAKKEGMTHFFNIDSDEYWPNFKEAKDEYFLSSARGSVCKMWTYFKKPTLRLKEPEGYYVPFIHELKPETRVGNNPKYPFWADPTRRVNETNVIELKAMMHHMSWIRKDIERKVRNSTAPHDKPENNEYLKDYNRELKDGDYIHCYKQELIEIKP